MTNPTKKKTAWPRRTRGFTLIELMVALIVGAIVITGVFAFGTIQQGTAVQHRQYIRVQQALEGSMHSMARDVRMAGLGFSRICTEVRIWDEGAGRLLNPGAVDGSNLAAAATDDVTKEAYWVLRDGFQSHWRSGPDSPGNTIDGNEGTSASPTSAADSFDVMLGERNYTSGAGSFIADFAADKPVSGADAILAMRSSAALNPVPGSNDEAWMQQLFVPGSFVLLVPMQGTEVLDFRVSNQSQCALVQVTGALVANNGRWELPLSNQSQFNANFNELLDGAPADGGGAGAGSDWPISAMDNNVSVVPVGRLRWSRYEIDYRMPSRPYLVRSDIIGYDLESDAKINFPGCPDGGCLLPQLNLPLGDGSNVPRVVLGPMIEDMQVAVGCDGWMDSGDLPTGFPLPDPGFEERGLDARGPNKRVDERAVDGAEDRGNDEWVGNAQREDWAPDCVYYGTGERNAAEWAAEETAPAPGFRLSPQLIRITLLGKSDTSQGGSDASLAQDFYTELAPIEDRPVIDTVVEDRGYQVLTERFSPPNLRWKDPSFR